MLNYDYANMQEDQLITLASSIIQEYEETKNNPYSKVKLQDIQKLERYTQRARFTEEGLKVHTKTLEILERDARIKPKEFKSSPNEYQIRQSLSYTPANIK